MKKIVLIFLSFSTLLFTNCQNDDDGGSGINEINSFIYRGLNTFYLYKDQSPNLVEGRFRNDSEVNSFVNMGGSPETFFERLTVDFDRFSVIVNDFEILEGFFRGESLSNGLKFRRIRYESDNVFIVILDVVKNSPAADLGIERGMLFNKINGVQMNINNQAQLFTNNSFTLEEATVTNNTISPTGNTFSLNKVNLNENPIAIAKVIEEENFRIGYLQYNSFLTNYEEELNEEFKKFKSENLSDFVLDLRYNGGGSVNTANILCGMITGDFKGETLIKEKWNTQLQEFFEQENPENLKQVFVDTTSLGTKINSLGLSKLYVITTKEETASSSELVINSLKPYIEVVVIGDENGTVGKSQGSLTLYDSPNFDRENLNTNHKYAMQPLVVDSVNSEDIGVPTNGILPDIIATEDILNLGALGDPEEPLLKLAIDNITGRNSFSAKKINSSFGIDIGGSNENSPTFQRMYFN